MGTLSQQKKATHTDDGVPYDLEEHSYTQIYPSSAPIASVTAATSRDAPPLAARPVPPPPRRVVVPRHVRPDAQRVQLAP